MNPQQQIESIRQQALDIQGSLNTMQQPAPTPTRQLRSPRQGNTVQPSPIVDPTGAIEATALRNAGTPALPQPSAPTEQETFQAGIAGEVERARTSLEQTLMQERDAALKRQDELNKRLELMMKESDPTKRDTFQQEQSIIQNQLNAAETASASLEEDFNRRRAVVSELDTLLTQGNQLIDQARNSPISKYRSRSVATEMQNVQARAGVLNAVVAGLDGNISMAHSIIGNASNAVASVWQDQLAYNQAYMNLVNNGQLAKNKIQDDFAQSQIALSERKLNQLEETQNYIQKLMIDPASAQFLADAGITLNDSVDEINAKMAEQTKRDERTSVMNDLKLEGYEYVPFPGDRTDVVTLEIGGQSMSFVPPVDELRELQIEQARANIQATRALAAQRSGGGASGMTLGYQARGLDEEQIGRLNQLGLSPAQQELVSAIMRGESPPIPPNNPRTKEIQSVLAGLAALGYDNTRAVQDWTSMQKRLQSMNSAQQVRLFQAVSAMEGSVQQARNLYAEWEATGLATRFPVLNRAALQASQNLPGEAGVVARTLNSHIEDMAAELATIYRGGNSPTDAAFASAQKSLSSNWTPEQFFKNIELIEQNLAIRKSTMASAAQVPGNMYAPPVNGQPAITNPNMFESDEDVFNTALIGAPTEQMTPATQQVGGFFSRLWGSLTGR